MVSGTIAHLPIHDLASSNPIVSFQHQMLSLVSGVCANCCRKELCEVMAEMPVRLKLFRLGARMCKYVDRDINSLKWGDDGPDCTAATSSMVLRTGKRTNATDWKGVDKKDLGDRIVLLGHHFNISEEKNKYCKKSPECLEFDLDHIIPWVKEKNEEISRIIEERRLGIRD